MSGAASTSLHPLITQTLVETKKFYCPFLDRGYCREASRCNFSHDNSQSIRIPNDYCHFYLANQCLYGQDCKFRHNEPPISSSEPTTSSGQRHSDEEPHVVVKIEADEFVAIDGHHHRHHLHNHHHQYIGGPSDDEEGAHYHQQAPPYVDEECQLFEEMSYRFSSSLPSLSTTATTADHSSDWDHLLQQQNGHLLARRSTSHGETVSAHLDNNSENFKTSSSIASYAKICKGKNYIEPSINPKKDYPLCPYSSTAGCQFPPGQCSYLHGLDCDLCGRPCLHPYDLDQQRQHREDCLREHEREMELSFAVQRSKDKVCGICMDTVVEKKPITSSRFGILEKCNHIFCLDCIRKWRGTKQFETRTIRACPECRVSSDFVVPSKYWVEDQDDKEKLIHDYKAALRAKPCKYFDEGKGECPFAGSCFYKHAYPDGRIAKMDTPKPRRRVYGSRGPTNTVANYILWNILTSTDDDDWSNDELESLYLDPDYATTDDEGSDLDGTYDYM